MCRMPKYLAHDFDGSDGEKGGLFVEEREMSHSIYEDLTKRWEQPEAVGLTKGGYLYFTP